MKIKYTKQGDYLIPNLTIKTSNQLEWIKLMNNYKKTAEEIIKKEIIYV